MAAQGPDVEAVLRNAFQCPYGEALSPAQSSCRPEFLQHLKQFPNDTNFVIEPKAGAGFGTVLCMENACFTEIPLEPSPFKPDDGGAERGVGWLQKYGEHIQRSPEHVAARNARIQTDKAIKAEAPPDSWTPKIKQSPSANASALSSDAEPLVSTSQAGRDRKPAHQPLASGSGSSTNGASTSLGFGKAPKKRPSDPKPSSSAGPVFSDDDLEPLDKKPKLDAEPGVLSQARQNTLDRPDMTAASSAVAVAQRKFDALRAREQAALTAYTAKSLEPMAQRLPTWQAEFADIAAKYTAIATETRSARVALDREKQNAQRVALANGNAPATSGYGVPAGDVTMAAMNALSGQMPGGYPLHNDDSDDEDAALWRAVDGGRDLNQEELDEFVKGVCDSEGFEGNANVNNAATVIGLKDQKDYLPHVRIRLMPHQIIACAWMKNQEAGKQYGGILADEMGLGKTIEAIVTCILNPSKDPKEKTTLVLAPLALLQQWKDELEEKVEKDHVSVLIYHGPDRKSYKERHLRKYDFVLTTYSTLVHDYGDEESLEKKAKQKAKRQQKNTGEPQDWEDFLESGEDGPLFKMCWYRVIIDEAQSIRNRNTKISRAVTRLDSLYRWALTGTPVTNSLADLYPIFRFLQLKPWYDWTRYRDHVVKWEKNRADIAGSKAQVILRTCMLRRKKDSKLDGKELITLPKKTITMNELEFSPEEREIYEMVETRAQQKFNKFLKAGTVMQNYSHVLVLLLRLRQLCVHPALIVDAEQTIAKKEEMKQQIKEDATRARREVGADFVALLRKKRLEAAVERVRAEQDGTEIAEDECAICVEAYAQNENGAVVTRCGHIFCSGCVEDYLKGAAPQDHDDEGAEEKCKANQRPCPMCRKPFAREEVYMLAAFEPTDQQVCDAADLDAAEGDVDDDEDETLGGFIVDDDEDEDEDRDYGKPRSKKAAKMPNRAIIQDSEEEVSEAEDDSVPRRKSEKARDKSKSTLQDKGKGKGKGKESATTWSWGEQEPSTKILWAYNELERMFTEDPTDKVIIISSFTSALDLMDEFLQRKNIRTCRYQGDMGISEREQTLRILKKSKKCRVMLLSLKCGGVGLTLTRANRVIALDLAWSTAVESQAFDRVHRIGQEKEVVVNRLTIKNTVEQRILDLQSRKQGLADAATGEGTGKKMGKLTVDDLAGLFGLNRRGERIRPRVARAASDE